MPSINIQINHLGPVVETHIGVSMPRRAAMELANVAVPDPVMCRLLIDTGASATCIDPGYFSGCNSIQAARLQFTRHLPMNTTPMRVINTILV